MHTQNKENIVLFYCIIYDNSRLILDNLRLRKQLYNYNLFLFLSRRTDESYARIIRYFWACSSLIFNLQRYFPRFFGCTSFADCIHSVSDLQFNVKRMF